MTLHCGDCLDVMRAMEPESVDAIVTDPPYELGFMGKGWDAAGVAFDPETWRAALRVLKPGGHLLAFGGTRTHHRLMVAIEDAGFEIRDCLMWLYGSGFPKSHNLTGDWQGFGTALKPAWEPIILARKPLIGIVAANVQAYGTGAINVEACRIEGEYKWRASDSRSFNNSSFSSGSFGDGPHPSGRWPANLCLDEDAAALLDAMSGERKSGGTPPRRNPDQSRNVYSHFAGMVETDGIGRNAGGASRFFYVAKSSRAERNAGLEGMPEFPNMRVNAPRENEAAKHANVMQNHHPTVKPLALMRWLCRLITPPGGLVLDPFMGSGSTGCAAALEGFAFVGIEREPDYCEIAERRIAYWAARREPEQLALEVLG